MHSEAGRGSLFQVYLPATSDPLAAALPAPAAPRAAAGERILYLDDEESLVLVAQAMLQRLGYRVHGFTRSEQAIAAFRADPNGFDLLITDFNMPGASGLQVAADLLRLRPDLPVVLASGFVTAELCEQAQALGVREVIHKPHLLDELAAAIQRQLTPPH